MSASDRESDFSGRPIPELIKHLWDLYFMMSLDPALEASADHVRQAVQTLEEIRRLAYQISEEKGEDKEPASKTGDTENDKSKLTWLRSARPGSPLKH